MGYGEHDDDAIRFSSLYWGTVAEREDPEGLGRVRLLIPSIYDDEPSPWAWPVGGVGGGVNQRGFFDVPEKNADVAVLFLQGDPEYPVYLSGPWGKGEAVTTVGAASVANKPDVRAYETKKGLLTFDDGAATIQLKEKTGNAYLQLSNAKIEIGGAATEKGVKGDTLLSKLDALAQAFETHFHPSGVGPTGVPANAATVTTLRGTFSAFLSAIVFIK